jgi:hypothetical protein
MKIKILPILLAIFFTHNLMADDCIYTAKQSSDNPYPENSPQGECGKLLDDDNFQIYQSHLDRLLFSGDDPAPVYFRGKMFYITKAGTSARVHLFDNGADFFVEGLTRTILRGKYGFMDKKLNVIIKPMYDFVFPFKKGLAVVCNGCNRIPDGDYSMVSGGKWGAINKKGEIVYSVIYTEEKLYKKLNQANLTDKKVRNVK